MPYRLRWEGHGVYRHFFGVVSPAEFKRAYDEMTGDVRYDGIRYIISDYLEAQPSADFSERHVAAFAELERVRYYDSPDTVHATVAKDPGILALARYYGSLHLVHPEATFLTVEEARHWIASNPKPAWRAAMGQPDPARRAPAA